MDSSVVLATTVVLTILQPWLSIEDACSAVDIVIMPVHFIIQSSVMHNFVYSMLNIREFGKYERIPFFAEGFNESFA
jgi:hypothetical protein